jgi:hypothetical protein
MQRQRELFHSLPHIRHEASGFTFVLETDDDIIGKAHNDDSTTGMALAPPVCPEIEDVMQVDICQQWRGYRPLGGACLRRHKFSFFHHACFQPLVDKAVYTTVADAKSASATRD